MNDGDRNRQVRQFMKVCREGMLAPGLDGWLAWKVAHVTAFAIIESRRRNGDTRYSPDTLARLGRFIREIEEFTSVSNGEKSQTQSMLDRPDDGPTPSRLRLEPGGPLVSVASLLKPFLVSQSDLSFHWLASVAHSPATIHSLVHENLDALGEVILLVSHLEVATWRILGPRFEGPVVKRIVAILRSSSDQTLLRTGFLLLIGSSFARHAGVRLLGKMLKACDPGEGEEVSILLFGGLRRQYTSDTDADHATILKLAHHICQRYSEFPLSIIQGAASHLHEYQPVKLPPILELEDVLGLRCGG